MIGRTCTARLLQRVFLLEARFYFGEGLNATRLARLTHPAPGWGTRRKSG